jgi:hypothetical protein
MVWYKVVAVAARIFLLILLLLANLYARQASISSDFDAVDSLTRQSRISITLIASSIKAV